MGREARGLWGQVKGSPGYIPFLKTKTTEEVKVFQGSRELHVAFIGTITRRVTYTLSTPGAVGPGLTGLQNQSTADHL